MTLLLLSLFFLGGAALGYYTGYSDRVKEKKND